MSSDIKAKINCKIPSIYCPKRKKKCCWQCTERYCDIRCIKSLKACQEKLMSDGDCK